MAGGAARFCDGMYQLVILINMSVIGTNPSRDKKAHRIIYGGFSGYVALLNFLGGCMGAPPMVSALNNRRKKSYQDRAWEIYAQTGDIKKAIKIFFWDPLNIFKIISYGHGSIFQYGY